jgi:vitamin B12 transporter
MSANYSWIALSETAIRIPKHKANLSLNYSPKPTQQLSAIYAFTGSRKDTNFSTYEQISLEAFSVVDLQYSFPLGLKNVNAFLSANNVFNSDFVETLGYQTLGRNIRFGVQFQL